MATVDDEISVFLGNLRFANLVVFEAELVDELTCADGVGIFENAACAGCERLAVAAFVLGIVETFLDVFGAVGISLERRLQGVISSEFRRAAVIRFDFVALARDDISIFIEKGDVDELIESFRSHRARVHSQSAAKIAWDALHPLETAETRDLGAVRDFFEPHACADNERVSIDAKFVKLAAARVNHGAANAAIADEKIRATADHADGNAAIFAIAHSFGEAIKCGWLNPKLRGATDEKSGVTAHWFVKFEAFNARFGTNFVEDFQVTDDFFPDFMDISRAEREEKIAFLELISNDVVRIFLVR